MLGNDITLCIAGNKVDLEKERHVTVDEAETYVVTAKLIALVLRTVSCGQFAAAFRLAASNE